MIGGATAAAATATMHTDARAELHKLLKSIHTLMKPAPAHALLTSMRLFGHVTTDAFQALRLLIAELSSGPGLRQSIDDGSLSVADYLEQPRNPRNQATASKSIAFANAAAPAESGGSSESVPETVTAGRLEQPTAAQNLSLRRLLTECQNRSWLRLHVATLLTEWSNNQ